MRLAVLAASAAASVPPAFALDSRWEGGFTAVAQYADDSRTDAEVTASLDLVGSLDTENGQWLLYIEASSTPRSNGVSALYPTVNADARSVLTREGSGGIQISELSYTHTWNDERSLMVGLVDPSAWLDRGRIANDENQHFINGSFVNNATIEFPDYTLGAIYRRHAEDRPEITFVLTGSDGIADIPDRSYQDLLDLTSDERGVFAGAGIAWHRPKTSYRIGAWYRSDDHPVGGSPDENEANYGTYAVFGRQIGEGRINLRVGFANSDVSIADRFISLAWQRRVGPGLLGAGAAHTSISSGFQTGGDRDAFDSEIYYRIPFYSGKGHVTPSIQYVETANLSSSDVAANSSTVVAGVRFHFAF